MSWNIDHWAEWKKICSVMGCSEPARSELKNFINGIGWKIIKADAIHPGYAEKDYPLSCFDVDLFIKEQVQILANKTQSESDKRPTWKEALATAVWDSGNDGNEIYIVRSYAGKCLRTALHKRLKNEGNLIAIRRRIRWTSLQIPTEGENDSAGRTLEEVLESLMYEDDLTPEDENIYDAWAKEMAPAVLQELSRDDRILLLAASLGLPLNAPVLLQALGRGHAAVYERWHNLSDRLYGLLLKKIPERDEDAVFLLSKKLFHEICVRNQREVESLEGSEAILETVQKMNVDDNGEKI